MPTARIVCTGDELVRGLRINTNAAYLAKELCGLGILPTAHVAVSDNQEDIEAALACAAAEADVVLVTGGLGPTEDDRTRHALAAFLGQPLEENPDALRSIQQRLSHYGRGLSESQHRQALLPNSAEWLPNSVGTAPGIYCRHDGAEIFCLPGPPAELEPMFTNCVAPRLKEIAGDEFLVSASLHTFGAGEATVGENIADLMVPGRNPAVAITVHGGIVSIHIHAAARAEEEARLMLGKMEQELRRRLGAIVFASGAETLQEAVVGLLRKTGRHLAVAESCTGGLVASAIVEVPGVSEFFLEGVVCYSNESKVNGLGITDELIREHGAVSEPVVRAMASGMLKRSGADIAIAITGIAGPTGGTPEKPVGLVWFAIADEARTETWQRQFGGTRELVRMRAARTALNLLWIRLMEE